MFVFKFTWWAVRRTLVATLMLCGLILAGAGLFAWWMKP